MVCTAMVCNAMECKAQFNTYLVPPMHLTHNRVVNVNINHHHSNLVAKLNIYQPNVQIMKLQMNFTISIYMYMYIGKILSGNKYKFLSM